MLNLFNCQCIICHATLMIAWHGICLQCSNSINNFNYCGKCGNKTNHFVNECIKCKTSEPIWDHIVFVSNYSSFLPKLIWHYKYYKQFWYDKCLARLLLLAIRTAQREHHLKLPQTIIPIPLSNLKYMYRGFNQTELIANYLGKWLNIEVKTDLLIKIQHTKAQVTLSAYQRKYNVKESFKYIARTESIESIALVDDIMTTGSTLREACLALRKNNKIKEIQVWILCKT